MPGAIAKNLKKADLAEDFGRLLIRSFCAVAPVSRTDDFGIDTLATLLEEDENSHLRELATATFGVQFKARSVTEIKFVKEHEAQWLVNLELPYFIGSVDLDSASMNLYCINLLTSLPNYHIHNSFILHLGEIGQNDDIVRYTLGEPILTIDSSDINNSQRLEKLKNIMRVWITSELVNIRQRKLGQTTNMNWETNEIPEINGHHKMLMSGGENLDILNTSIPYLDASLTELRLNSNSSEFDREIESIVSKLATLGIFLESYDSFDFEELKKKINPS